MEMNPHDMTPGDMHKLLIGCVVPRPIAWVSSLDSAGTGNLAPFSFFNVVSSHPAALSVVCTYNPHHPSGHKDTLRNVLATGEYVINVVTEATMIAMNQSAALYPEGVDEFGEVGVTPAPALTVRPPRVAESPICFECRLHTTVPMGAGPGSATLMIGLVSCVHVRDDLIDERYRIDIQRLQPVGRLAGNGYCYVRDTFDLVREPYAPAKPEK